MIPLARLLRPAHPRGVFEPMFRNTMNVGGVPANVIVLALGIIGTFIGSWLMRRALAIEPEVHSFRTTAPKPANWLLRAGLGLGFVAVALVAISLPR
jgi:H+/Cl- antiporter ClcA